MTFASITRRALLPAVFLASAAFTVAQQPAPNADGFTFCSYNVKNWLTMDRFDPEKKQTTPASPKPDAEKARIVEILTAIRPDALGVCEIGTADDLADLQTRLKAAGLDLPYTEMAHGGDDTRRLGFLSRFPITARNSQTALTYKLGDTEFPFQRGILDVTVKCGDGFDTRFLGVHLKSMREIPEADQAQMRRAEARLLRKHMDGIFTADPKVRLLAYGDFNEHRNEPAVDIIMGDRQGDTAMLDVQLRDRDGHVWTHFWDSADSYSRLDYFFASRVLRPHLDYKKCFIYSARDFDKASDHRPIVLRVTYKPWNERK